MPMPPSINAVRKTPDAAPAPNMTDTALIGSVIAPAIVPANPPTVEPQPVERRSIVLPDEIVAAPRRTASLSMKSRSGKVSADCGFCFFHASNMPRAEVSSASSGEKSAGPSMPAFGVIHA
ncbi:hypothetical protein D3C80_967120 [compost metagenome]